jgi:tRNA 2-selenouridine synthase
LNSEILRELFKKNTAYIDVRAPVEFAQGHLPGAINLPILNDEERAIIGTTYKKEGSEAATKLGYQLISGEVKNSRLQQWLSFIKKNPEAYLYCFRGGQRSQITQKWMAEAGVQRPLIIGGYKRARTFLMNETERLSESQPLLILSGTTGSGKTTFLNAVSEFYQGVDLERLACHRGSAFGAMSVEQPAQTYFENNLAVHLIRSENKKPLLLEDESHLIGRCAIPKIFFEKMRQAPVLWLDVSLEERIQNIYYDYITINIASLEKAEALQVFSRYKNSMQGISKKLGGLRTQELLDLLIVCEKEFLEAGHLENNKKWIEKLLVYYYDPLYLSSLERRRVKILFKGSAQDCFNYLKEA